MLYGGSPEQAQMMHAAQQGHVHPGIRYVQRRHDVHGTAGKLMQPTSCTAHTGLVDKAPIYTAGKSNPGLQESPLVALLSLVAEQYHFFTDMLQLPFRQCQIILGHPMHESPSFHEHVILACMRCYMCLYSATACP